MRLSDGRMRERERKGRIFNAARRENSFPRNWGRKHEETERAKITKRVAGTRLIKQERGVKIFSVTCLM
jgi:hypothetical protein